VVILTSGNRSLVGGFFLIWKYQWNKQKTAFFLATGLLGFVAFELSLFARNKLC
jgi:hypothetical protein